MGMEKQTAELEGVRQNEKSLIQQRNEINKQMQKQLADAANNPNVQVVQEFVEKEVIVEKEIVIEKEVEKIIDNSQDVAQFKQKIEELERQLEAKSKDVGEEKKRKKTKEEE